MNGFCASIRRFWVNTFRWFDYQHTLRNAVDYDYSSILEVERHQIKRVRDYIDSHGMHMNKARDIAKMNLALRLLDIMEEDGEADLIEPNDGLFIENDDNLWKMNLNSKWVLNRYVNTRNAHRFLPQLDPECFADSNDGDLFRDHLRVEKAWHLYHKLRLYSLRSWWD